MLTRHLSGTKDEGRPFFTAKTPRPAKDAKVVIVFTTENTKNTESTEFIGVYVLRFTPSSVVGRRSSFPYSSTVGLPEVVLGMEPVGFYVGGALAGYAVDGVSGLSAQGG